LTIPASVTLPENSRLELRAFHGESRPRVTRRLPVDVDSYVTWLTVDKPWYQPGETVFYRSLTLTRFSMNAQHEMPVEYQVLDPAGSPLAESVVQGVTQHGVGNGTFAIPAEAPGGQYTL